MANLPLYHQRTPVPPLTATSPASITTRIIPSSVPSSSPLLTSSNSPPGDSTKQKTFLSRTALDNSTDHTANFEQLLFFRECFHKREFWEEVVVLDRLYYRNKSQHRQAGFFQRFYECRRLFSRIKELDIAGLMDELVKKFYSDKSQKALTVKSQWDSIPYRSTVAFTMVRIIGCILLLRKAISALHETYVGFYQLMSKTQFMSVALIVIGLCSRLSVISKAWTHELVDCYSLLEQWIKAFPKNEPLLETVDYEKELPESLGSLIAASLPDIILDTPLPTTLVEPTQQQSSTEGIDLGEVIQREERLEPALEASLSLPQQKSSQPSKKATSLKRKASENDDDDDRIDLSTPATEIHDSLLGELDTVFGNKDSIFKPAQGNSSVISAMAGMNEIKGKKRKKRTSKTTTVELSQSTPSSPGQNSMDKSKTGSTTNFDDIFNMDRERPVSTQSSPGGTGNTSLKKSTTLSVKMSQSDKSDIEDIFSSIEKPKKKKKKTEMSEIDAIFGPPKKKKKKVKSMEQ